MDNDGFQLDSLLVDCKEKTLNIQSMRDELARNHSALQEMEEKHGMFSVITYMLAVPNFNLSKSKHTVYISAYE